MPRLPRETNVDVTKCHACHVKRRRMSPSATPATQRAAASTASAENPVRHQSPPSAVSATPATWNECGCDQVPRLPRETKVDVAKCHACHLVPRLPRKVKVDVTKCHACHAKSRGVHGVSWEPGAPPEPAQCRKCHACHVKRMWMWPSATPATWNEGGCRQVPRLSRRWMSGRTSCVWASCAWTSFVWGSCVWTSCVWTSCVMTRVCVYE